MSYIDIVNKTIADLTTVTKIEEAIKKRHNDAQKIEGIDNLDHFYEEKASTIRTIKYNYLDHLLEKLGIYLPPDAKRIVRDLDPSSMSTHIDTIRANDVESAFQNTVEMTRRLVGTDPIHVGDKLIFFINNTYTRGYGWQGFEEKLNTIGRFLNVIMNGQDPFINGPTILDYITKSANINPRDHSEQYINSTDIHKVKLFKNGKLKIWLRSYQQLDFIGALIRGELVDQPFVLADGTTVKCP